jgi:hypothetical protein
MPTLGNREASQGSEGGTGGAVQNEGPFPGFFRRKYGALRAWVPLAATGSARTGTSQRSRSAVYRGLLVELFRRPHRKASTGVCEYSEDILPLYRLYGERSPAPGASGNALPKHLPDPATDSILDHAWHIAGCVTHQMDEASLHAGPGWHPVQRAQWSVKNSTPAGLRRLARRKHARFSGSFAGESPAQLAQA